MKNYLTKLLDKMCCKHEWSNKLYDEHSYIHGGRVLVFSCKNCGRIKKITL